MLLTEQLNINPSRLKDETYDSYIKRRKLNNIITHSYLRGRSFYMFNEEEKININIDTNKKISYRKENK
jgi:hypothetical protein